MRTTTKDAFNKIVCLGDNVKYIHRTSPTVLEGEVKIIHKTVICIKPNKCSSNLKTGLHRVILGKFRRWEPEDRL